MKCTEEQSYTYSETLEILELITDEYKERIPQKLLSIFEENKLTSYSNHIEKNKPLELQSISPKTCALLALICLNYWCESENQKEDLRSIFEENEKEYQESLIDVNDPYNIFSNKKNIMKKEETIEEQPVSLQVEEEDVPLFKKIISKLFNIIKDKIKK